MSMLTSMAGEKEEQQSQLRNMADGRSLSQLSCRDFVQIINQDQVLLCHIYYLSDLRGQQCRERDSLSLFIQHMTIMHDHYHLIKYSISYILGDEWEPFVFPIGITIIYSLIFHYIYIS